MAPMPNLPPPKPRFVQPTSTEKIAVPLAVRGTVSSLLAEARQEKEPTQTITVRLPVSVFAKLEEIATRTDLSRTKVLEILIRSGAL